MSKMLAAAGLVHLQRLRAVHAEMPDRPTKGRRRGEGEKQAIPPGPSSTVGTLCSSPSSPSRSPVPSHPILVRLKPVTTKDKPARTGRRCLGGLATQRDLLRPTRACPPHLKPSHPKPSHVIVHVHAGFCAHMQPGPVACTTTTINVSWPWPILLLSYWVILDAAL